MPRDRRDAASPRHGSSRPVVTGSAVPPDAAMSRPIPRIVHELLAILSRKAALFGSPARQGGVNRTFTLVMSAEGAAFSPRQRVASTPCHAHPTNIRVPG